MSSVSSVVARAAAIALSFGFLLTQGQVIVSKSWLSDLLEGVNNLTKKIHSDVEHLNQQIRENVDSQVSRAYENVSSALKSVEKDDKSIINGTANVPPDEATNGPVIYVSRGHGARSRVFQAFYAPAEDGRRRYVERQDVVVGGKLFRTERVYANDTEFQEYRYSLDLDDPGARLQPVTEPRAT